MLTKRNARAGKTYAYGMFRSFKTPVTHKKNLTSRWTTVSVVKELSSDITRFFAGHSLMSGASIQVCHPEQLLIISEIFSGVPL